MSHRIAIRFAICGDLRFLSHQDAMRLFERAAVRAGLPLRWGQGFNPRPRFSLPLPRPLGVASEDELLVLDIEPPAEPRGQVEASEAATLGVDPDEALCRLAKHMPEGIRLLDAREAGPVPQPRTVRYGLPLPESNAPASFRSRLDDLMAMTHCVVQRQTDARGTTKPMDIRPFIQGLEWDPAAGRLTMTLFVTGGGAARPAEVLAALGLDPADWAHRLVREHVDWQF